jgi:hypothetical protein
MYRFEIDHLNCSDIFIIEESGFSKNVSVSYM